jgi:TnpA family transposase
MKRGVIMQKKKKRLTILSEHEYQELYSLPEFNDAERQYYFSLSPSQLNEIKLLPLPSKLYFILQFGYFRAKRQFFSFHFNRVKDDVTFIMQIYFHDESSTSKIPSRNIQSKIKKKILTLLQCNGSITEAKVILLNKAKELVRFCNNTKEIFRTLLCDIENKNIILPGYTTMQDILSAAIIGEENRIMKIIKRELPPDVRQQLNALLKKEETFYRLTELKADLRNFNYKQMSGELKKHHENEIIYLFAKEFLPQLEISQHNIQYYASLAAYYPRYKLQRFPESKTYLYLLCYVHYRHQKISENITQAYLYQVDRFHAEAVAEANDIISKEKNRLDLDQEKTGLLIGLFDEEPLFDLAFREVAKKAYEVVPRDMIRKIKQHLTNQESYRTNLIWKFYVEKHRTIAMNIRPMFESLRIDCETKNNAVFESVLFMQSVFASNKTLKDIDLEKLPNRIISNSFKPYLYQNEKIDPHAYEFLVYYRLRNYIGNHKIYLNDTIQYKNFCEDIKSVQNWERDQHKILKKLDNQKLNGDIDNRLTDLEIILEDLYVAVNQRIESGENTYIKITEENGKKNWTLAYPTEDDEFDHQFYRKLPPVNISDAYDFVNEKCNFMQLLTHVNSRHIKSQRDYQCTKACVIANGTRQGIDQMATRSNLDLQSLRTNQTNYVRLETLRAACDRLIRQIEEMTLFDRYNYQKDVRHGSIDGSKHGTKRQTAKSRYSPKYFGLEKGISALNMILNNLSVNTKVIGANEHESHYSFDLCYNNTSGVTPDILSTDTAGSNQVNFLLYDLIDIQYAPCYKSLQDRIKNLHGFKPLSHYKNILIKPAKVSNKQNIITEWPNIQKILAAMLIKETTQSVVVKKICSHKNQSKLKKALWEYNNIHFSIYMLRFIDNPALRRGVRIALNRGEGYHKLYNGIAKIGGKKFRGMSELEIEIWHECTRLLTLITVYYNMYILSQLIEKKLQEGDEKAARLIEKVSPLALRHLNFGGIYHYADNEGQNINMEAIVAALNKALVELMDNKK